MAMHMTNSQGKITKHDEQDKDRYSLSHKKHSRDAPHRQALAFPSTFPSK